MDNHNMPENQQQKLENQQSLIRQLTQENEELYHQFNHLMIRNNKLLKRIDDLQKIIDDLHLRVEELQLISNNQLQLNDRLRRVPGGKEVSGAALPGVVAADEQSLDLDLEQLYIRWKSYPGQVAQNAPNLRKQVLMLAYLYRNGSLRANELFQLTGVGGVTGARYVSSLKRFGLIAFNGARKKGHYSITPQGIQFIEGKDEYRGPGGGLSMPAGIPVKHALRIPDPTLMDGDDL